MKLTVDRLISVLITLAVPVMIWVGIIRLLVTPVFVNLEYNLPNFPEDTYGFSKGERLAYAHRARRYLINDAGIAYLGDLQFDDGSPLFIARELRHMKDVKAVIRGAFAAFWGALIVTLGGVIWAWRRDKWRVLVSALSSGGWLTLIVIISILILTLVSFRTLFFGFHRIFFQGNTWLFRYSDTLIRLFPMRLWRDAFIAFGVLSAGSGLLLGLLNRIAPGQRS